MIKQIIDNNAEVKPNSKKLEALREYFAGCFTADGAFDMERFKDMMKDEVNISNEGYSLDFLGKDYANLIASIDTTTVIEPDLEHNSKPENKDSENIYISGDNLDALKHLLKSYAGKVKCIYIDPPYNTGSDGFVYNDSFKFTPEELEKKLSIDEEEAKRILDLTSRGSSTHSAWLMFMSPRLQLARELLSKDGVIFISIDDNEQANLKLLCDYVFGEENFISSFIWKKRQQPDSRTKNGVSMDHDYLLCYGRREEDRIRGKLSDMSKYSNPDNDPRGDWMSDNMVGLATESQRPNLHYELENPATGIVYACPPTGWRYGREHMAELISNNEILWPTDANGRPRRKKFVKDLQSEYTGFSSLFDTVYSSQGTRELTELFDGKDYFDFPKPVDYIKQIVEQGIDPCSDKDIFVVDFFSGSGTTAQAVMKLNDKRLHYIMVQWKELFAEQSEAYKAGYRTIDEIGQERIKRAAAKIKAENPLFAGDLGFQHYTLRDVPENVLDKIIDFDPNVSGFANNLLEEFGRETVLETWKVRDGYGMNAKMEEVKLADYTAYQCGDHLYLTDEGMSDEAITALVDKYGEQTDWGPHYVVLFGYSFNFGATDALKKNLPLLNEGEKQIKINIDIRY
ncbi:MAG: site-specific DNA-methyltransferase [Prevotella sp.]|jgi:adenine specific DNA methylase Mod|nr:site-specific DNA-methyltransferase [Prevotella sp.]